MEIIGEISEKGTLFGEIPCAAVVFSYDGNTVKMAWANEKFFTVLGCEKKKYLEIEPNEYGFRVLGREYASALIGKVEALSKNCSVFGIDIETGRIDGKHLSLYAEISVEIIGREKRYSVLLHDVSQMDGAAKESSEMIDMMFSVLAISADYIFRYDKIRDLLMVYKNIGGSFVNCLTVDDFENYFNASGYLCEEDEENYGLICNNLKTGVDSGVFEMRMKLPSDPDYRWYRFTIKTDRGSADSEHRGAVGKIEDISTIKIANQRLIDKAERDPLTKLYNKSATKQLIQNFLRTDSRDTYDAFIIVDVDNFKNVNDTLGHLFGDSVLTDIAQEMQDLFRANDVIGRIGGDEFIVFLRGMNHKSHIESKAADICKIFSLIYSDEDTDDGVKISGSLGIALFPKDGDTFDELYKKADTALYKSKRAGKSCYTFYTGEDTALPSDDDKPVTRVERYQKGMDFFSNTSGFGGDILSSAFDMAEAGIDMDSAVKSIIEKTGKHFRFGRIVVSECGPDGRTFRDTYIWRSKSADAARTDSIRFSNKELNEFCSHFDKNFLLSVYPDTESALKDNAYTAYLASNHIGSCTVCGFFRGGRLVGMVSFQDPAGSYRCSIDEAKVLKELTRTIFSYLIKLRESEKARDKSDYAAGYDVLTGLMNFRNFKSHVVKYMENAFENDKFVFLMADFSNFSYVNSRYGYNEGNELLKSFASALSYFSDKVRFVCRVEADRFCVLAEYDDKIVTDFENFTRRFSSNELLVGGNTSFGIMSSAYIPDMTAAFSFDQSFDNANLALKFSKSHSIAICSVYKAEMREELNRTIEIAGDAMRALKNSEFKVFFQPKVSVSQNKIVGAEALVRWIKPNGAVVTPDSFVPFLEKNGYIVKIDFFVYEEVCKYLRRRIDSGMDVVPISVNVSRIHMLKNDFIPHLVEIVHRYRIDPALIELELTESVFIANEEDAIRTLALMREKGFKVSIDDFGSGYSSLSLLKRMPVDVLKIDKGFFSGEHMQEKESIMLSSVIDMADKMNIDIICEGIETEEQVDFLKHSKCDMAQGFFYAKPVPMADFEDMLEHGIKA
ncbi:MAG: EAL domain-containing protein [Ruminiclostridium sp.]|nr:EAL domain-containing protein [Ruminiclostridium sp.]